MKPTPLQLLEAALQQARSDSDPTLVARRLAGVLKAYGPIMPVLCQVIEETQRMVDGLPMSSKIKAQQLLDEAKTALGYNRDGEGL